MRSFRLGCQDEATSYVRKNRSSNASAEELAAKLTGTTWTCCTAFALEGYLWLNDATSPDGGQEFAVLQRVGPNGCPRQIESITFSWCDEQQALEYIRQTLQGEDDGNDFARDVRPVLQTPAEHGRCPHCA
jgi:hypothetical protein